MWISTQKIKIKIKITTIIKKKKEKKGEHPHQLCVLFLSSLLLEKRRAWLNSENLVWDRLMHLSQDTYSVKYCLILLVNFTWVCGLFLNSLLHAKLLGATLPLPSL